MVLAPTRLRSRTTRAGISDARLARLPHSPTTARRLGIYRLAIWLTRTVLDAGHRRAFGYPRISPGLAACARLVCPLPFVCWANVSASG